jgi:hypothetical protein
MAGKIKQIWAALAECFHANSGPLTSAQIVAWVDSHYGDSEFHPITLRNQIYRSCVNVQFAQKYDAPKILIYNKQGRTYSLVGAGPPEEEPAGGIALDFRQQDSEYAEQEDQSDIVVGVEAQLRDYLAKNLSKLEKGLTFWQQSPPSVEFCIEKKRIDILAKDSEGLPVVIELKKGNAYDKVVGQALLYQALVAAKLKVPRVRVILVANEISPELRWASSGQLDFKLFEYELTMQLNLIAPGITEEEGLACQYS